LLEVKKVTVRYDTAMVLDEASLTVDKGELVGLVGPNGAGKTTLLRAIAGLIKWEKEVLRGTRQADITFEGSIEFEGGRIENLSASEIARRGLILCPERGRPFAEMTVRDNLLAGERQMLCIGRALMHEPKFLLVDEPSSGLAPMLKEDLFKRIEEIYHELGVTILLAEQDVSFAFDLAARNYVMSRGHIIAHGTAQELLKDETIRRTYLGL